MKNILTCWNTISNKFKKSQIIFLMCDYDGTLTPIVKRPQDALISTKMKKILRRLRDNKRFKVAIISGRGLAELKKKVGLKGIIYAGNHGMELEAGNIHYTNKKAKKTKKIIKDIYNKLVCALSSFKGVIIENKSLTLSVHYRLVSASSSINKIFDIVAKIANQKNIRKTYGKKVIEIRPKVNWDKGRIVNMLIQKFENRRKNRFIPLYLGDDTTDEDAFRVLKNKGIGIFIGNPKKKTHARYYLNDTDMVEEFLQKLHSENK